MTVTRSKALLQATQHCYRQQNTVVNYTALLQATKHCYKLQLTVTGCIALSHAVKLDYRLNTFIGCIALLQAVKHGYRLKITARACNSCYMLQKTSTGCKVMSQPVTAKCWQNTCHRFSEISTKWSIKLEENSFTK